jgi:surface antigen
MTRRRLLGTAVAIGLLLGAADAAPAAATAQLRTSAVTCSITANQPVLSKTKQLTGSASVSCLATASTTVTVTVLVVELDGPVVDRMGGAFFATSTRSLVKSTKSVAWTVSTLAKACVNADGTGLEDYYTVVTITNGTATVGETVGRIDGWNC